MLVQTTPSPDVEALERLGDEIAELSAQLEVANARLLDLIREFDAREGWGLDGARSCAEWLAWRLGIELHAARERVRVARALGSLPKLRYALAHGELSYAKVRALTRVATPDTEDQLLAVGKAGTAAHVERLVHGWRHVDRAAESREMAARQRSRTLQVYQDSDGMVVVRGRLTPEVGAVLIQALNAARDRLYAKARVNDPEGDPPLHGQQQADALGIIAEAALKHDLDPGPSGDRYQVVVHVDAAVLRDPDQPGQSVLEDGQHVPAGTCRRLACDASRVVMGHDADGRTVEISARTRTIPPALRRALQHRDQGCRFPGCGLPFTQGHHIRHWAEGGPTTLSNLTLLCRRHHRSVHEDGFQVERPADGKLEFRRPDGRPLPSAPALPDVPSDAENTLRARNAGVQLHAGTLRPTWSGERFNVSYAISVLHPRAIVPSVQAIANLIDDDVIGDDRPYVVRRRKADGTDVDVRIETFDVEKYRCGLRAGDRLRLRRPLPDGNDGARTAEERNGWPWVVLTGSTQDPGTLWLRQPDGKLQSWPDDESIFEYFAKLPDF